MRSGFHIKEIISQKVWQRVIGVSLICFAIGLFLGGLAEGRFGLMNHLLNGNEGVYYELHDDDAPYITQGFYHLESQAPSSEYSIDYDKVPSALSNKVYYVDGFFTNSSEKHFNSIRLKFSLLDKDKNKIGTAIAYCDGLAAGQVWKFSASNTAVIESKAVVVSAALDSTDITF